jgi:hypothetical protein
MALPARRAIGPEPIPLPDVRRPDRMPSLPAWVASRVASTKREWQRSTVDGKYREIPTLPVNLTLNPVERDEITRHVEAINALCLQTPAESDEYEGATLIVLTKLMLALPSASQSDTGVEASGEAYQAALDDVPTWAVSSAVRRWYRGECGENQLGKPYDYRWRPAPADLRRVALAEKWKVLIRGQELQSLLDAEVLIEFSAEHRQEMLTQLSSALHGVNSMDAANT